MSPLLGSTGGSSEYSFRGTLDDWPNDFTSALTSQNITGLTPSGPFPVANITVTGINYKARVTVDNPEALLSIDGGATYVSASPTSPDQDAVFVRDNTQIKIKLEQSSGSESDFNKTYIIPVKIGKRQATWTVTTRAIDETPNSFTFTPLLNQEVGVAVTSNLVTIAGLETGFLFPIFTTGDGSYYRNGAGPFISGDISNGDKIYLATQTPLTFSTPKTLSVSVGTFTTSWGVLTRDPDSSVDPFSFTGVSTATNLGFSYVSNQVTISGVDTGIGLTTRISGPNAFYEIRKSDNTLRYTDPLLPSAPSYWQSGVSTSFSGDKLWIKLDASTNYSTTTVGILTVSNESASYIVTTRPTPFNTIPSAFSFASLTDQARGALVSSASTTLVIVDNISGTFGTASISTSSSGISPQFSVNSTTTWVSPPSTAQVKNGDVIRLRMTTPNINGSDGVTSSSITFKVDGTDTRQNLPGGSGYLIQTGSQQATWNVSTIARSCPITTFTLSTVTGVSINTDNEVTFTPSGYNTDCQMTVSVTSDSLAYNFVAVNGSAITATKTLTNVAPGSSITLRVRASSSYLTDVTSTVTVSNTSSGVTPTSSYSTNWIVRTTGDTTPASASLVSNLSSVESGDTFTLTWSSINCTSVRSVSWTPTTPTQLNGSATLTAPVTAGTYSYTITLYANPFASNYGSLTPDGLNPNYVTATVSITVTEDTTPVFTPNDFTNLTGESISGIGLTSNTIIISDISVPLTGIITGSTGASFYDSGSPSGIITSLTLNSGNPITLKVNSSPDYLTTTTAYLTVKDSLANIKANKSFSVTTADCTPTTATSTFGTGLNTVTLNSYPNSRYVDLNGATDTVQLLYGDSATGGVVTFIGSATGYYNVSTGTTDAGYYKDFSVNNGNPVIVTWNKIIDIIYYAYTSSIQRPPTILEVNQLLLTNSPIGYFTAGGFYDALRASLTPGGIPADNNLARNTSFPIYNSCPATSVNSIIKSGSYVGFDTGTYPTPPP